ncbi:hypothetical protein [Acinetobacter phage AB1I1M-1]
MSTLYSNLKSIASGFETYLNDDILDECVQLLNLDGRYEELLKSHECDALLVILPSHRKGGRIFFDGKERFENGTFVEVSRVMDVYPIDKEFHVMQTRNTKYLCIG